MKTIIGLLAAAAACLFVVPASAAVCLIGPPKDTLKNWLVQTGQTPLIEMNITISDTETMPAMLAVAANGEFTILYQNPKGLTCVIFIGKNARPATDNAEPKKPDNDT